jgi:hypothetical protein
MEYESMKTSKTSTATDSASLSSSPPSPFLACAALTITAILAIGTGYLMGKKK